VRYTGGKELERLAKFAARGRIRLEEILPYRLEASTFYP